MSKKYRKFLKNAKDGEVVTRFPPEPSGYLHIGHAKAALLNYHYAKMFSGKLIFRFDDTNPKKERDEYKESILQDVKTLEIYPDMFSNTSDHFQMIMDKCTQFITEGKGYCDATPHEKMKEQRMVGEESKYRNATPEENMAIWLEMIKGKQKDYCVRAKIDMKCKNKCMRDPVIYRHCDMPHQLTKDKFKVYPTYDFACPIVDSHEGVTHALRTNEYADRNHLYKWFLKNLNLREVGMQDYSRLNFIETTLSKRKLTWFVDNGYVKTWNDPRFPTVQGIIRRGLLINTIVEFMLEIGPSKNTNMMHWDKIWSLNRKNMDQIALKYIAISENQINVVVDDLEKEEVKMVTLHPKIAEIGKKPICYNKNLLSDREDFKDLKEGDKIVLIKWGVFKINKMTEEQVNLVYLPDDKDFKHPPKISWLPKDPAQHVDVTITEYGPLLNCDKPDSSQSFENFVNKDSMKKALYIAEGHVRTLEVGAYIQFERRGYMRLDSKEILDNDKLVLNFILIPDGKKKKKS